MGSGSDFKRVNIKGLPHYVPKDAAVVVQSRRGLTLPASETSNDTVWSDSLSPDAVICTCGVAKTMGSAGNDLSFHSDWCSLVEEHKRILKLIEESNKAQEEARKKWGIIS